MNCPWTVHTFMKTSKQQNVKNQIKNRIFRATAVAAGGLLPPLYTCRGSQVTSGSPCGRGWGWRGCRGWSPGGPDGSRSRRTSNSPRAKTCPTPAAWSGPWSSRYNRRRLSASLWTGGGRETHLEGEGTTGGRETETETGTHVRNMKTSCNQTEDILPEKTSELLLSIQNKEKSVSLR